MKQNQELTPKQVHNLALTPELRHSLAILQMPLMELETHISEQLLENCLLELAESNPEENPDEDSLFDSFPYETNTMKETTDDIAVAENDYLLEGNLPEEVPKIAMKDSIKNTYENLKTMVPSIQDYLISQLHLTSRTEQEKRVAEYLIGNIDADGYLRSETDSVAKVFMIPIAEVEDLLNLIQSFDPPGAGARSLKECLLLQLESPSDDLIGIKSLNNDLLPIVKTIIEDHLYDLADGRVGKISIQLKRPMKEVQEAIDFIKSLDPKPGRNFGDSNNARFIIPDVMLRKNGNEYIITINDPSNAHLVISPLYRKLLHEQNSSNEHALNFLKEKQNSATLLIKHIEQRKLTLYQITENIIKIQNEFFEKGPLYLKPLTLRKIAEMVGMHESTVSRAIADKYVETPQGIYSFKYFLNSSFESGVGERVSSVSIKRLMKEAIEAENPYAPLSDQQLVTALKKKEIIISRRTITKYREEMGILSSNIRRRY